MTRPIRTSRGFGRYVASEVDVVLGAAGAWSGSASPLIYCHGSGDTADTTQNKTGQGPLIRALAEHFAVGVADLGGATFGNDTVVTRIGEQASYLASAWGASGPVVLVGASMGALSALNYARAFPGNVAAVALAVPALDIADVYEANVGGVAAQIDAAYGGAYNDATHGPTHSPVQFAAALSADIPIALWAADDDLAARPATVTAFAAARPETGVAWVGNLGHTEAAITAAADSVLAFLLAL